MRIWVQFVIVLLIGVWGSVTIALYSSAVEAHDSLALYMDATKDCSMIGRGWVCGCRTKVYGKCVEWSCRCEYNHDEQFQQLEGPL